MKTHNLIITLDTSFSKLRENNIIQVRTENTLKSVGINTVGELIRKYSNLSELYSIKGFGRRSFMDVKNVMERTNDVKLSVTVSPVESIDTITEEYENLSAKKKACLEYIFQKKTCHEHTNKKTTTEDILSVRAKNALHRAGITLLQVLKWGNNSDMARKSIIALRFIGKDTVPEIVDFSKAMFNDFREIQCLSDASIERYLFMTEFDFLLPSDCRKCLDFKHTNGHLPMFYILCEYLKTSEVKGVMVFAKRHGISTHTPRSLEDIAIDMNYTAENIRRLHVDYTKGRTNDPMLKHITTHNDWNNYQSLFRMKYVAEDTAEWLAIRDAELPDISFSCFAWICSLLGKLNVLEVGDEVFLQNRKNTFNAVPFINSINDILSGEHDRKTIDLKRKFSISDASTEVFAERIIRILCAGHKDVIVRNNKLYLPKNYINEEKDICRILKRHMCKMSLDEITDEFNVMNRSLTQYDREKIRQYIQRSSLISSCGKTGYYGLTEWSDVYYGTIRDLVIKTLSESELPVHIGTIFDRVAPHFENTTLASIASSIEWDNAKRFVKFAEGYYGLSDKNYPDSFNLRIKKSILYPFDKRMEMFRHFVDEYHHYPFSARGEIETLLYRWRYNILNDVVSVTAEQKDLFYSMLEEFEKELIPRNYDEFSFHCYCQNYFDFIRQNGTLPTSNDGGDLAEWFNKNKDIYLTFNDFRKNYFTELHEYISSLKLTNK